LRYCPLAQVFNSLFIKKAIVLLLPDERLIAAANLVKKAVRVTVQEMLHNDNFPFFPFL
jgi:hypothetical protein